MQDLSIQALIFNKHEATPDEQKGDMGYLVQNYATTLINNMLNAISAITRSQVSDVDLPKYLISGHFHTPFSEDHYVVLEILSLSSVSIWFNGLCC